MSQQTILEALQASPVAPFLNMPMPQLPPLPQAPTAPAMPAVGQGPTLTQTPDSPALPQNPIDALMSGQPLAALPGAEQLMKPITDLFGGFGNGSFGAFDPTMLFQQSSSMIDSAMQLGVGGLKTLDQVWQSQAGQQVQATGQQAQGSGAEVSQRGTDIGTVVQQAADTVAKGNVKLQEIAFSFAETALGSAPLAFTPPGQTMLMAAAAEHIDRALKVVSETRAELEAHTQKMTVLSEPVTVAPAPGQQQSVGALGIAANVLEQFGKPILSTVVQGAQQLVEAGTQAAGVGAEAMTKEPATSSTSPSSQSGAGGQGSPGTAAAGGGFVGTGGRPGTGAPTAAPGTAALSGPSVKSAAPPAASGGAAASTTTSGDGAAATTAAAAAGAGGGFMPPMLGGMRNQNDEPDRTGNPYQYHGITQTDDTSGTVSPVLGADLPEEGEGGGDIFDMD